MVRRNVNGMAHARPALMRGVNLRVATPANAAYWNEWCAQAKALGFEWVRFGIGCAEYFANCTSGSPSNYDISGIFTAIDACAQYGLGVVLLIDGIPPDSGYFRELATGSSATRWKVYHRPPNGTWSALQSGLLIMKNMVKWRWKEVWKQDPTRLIFNFRNEGGLGGASGPNSSTASVGTLDSTLWTYLSGAGIAMQGTWDTVQDWYDIATATGNALFEDVGDNANLEDFSITLSNAIVDYSDPDELWIPVSLEGDLVNTSWHSRPTPAVANKEKDSLDNNWDGSFDAFNSYSCWVGVNSYNGQISQNGVTKAQYAHGAVDYLKTRLTLLPSVVPQLRGVIVTEAGFRWEWPNNGVALSTSQVGLYMGEFWERMSEVREIDGLFLYELRRMDVSENKWGLIDYDGSMAVSASTFAAANGVVANASTDIEGVTTWA